MSGTRSDVLDVDVVVVGGGTAGLNAAVQIARLGRSVVLLERRPEGQSGARWVNGVVPWQFERAGLDAPEPPERRGVRGAVHMISPTGAHRFTIDRSPIWEADMRLLVDRLRGLAVEAGVDIRWQITEPTLELVDGRPVRLHAQGPDGPITIGARLFVDAAGRTGVLRSQVPALDRVCPPVGDSDLCSAQQLVFEVADAGGASAFLASEGAQPHEALVTVGVSGGYSTVNIQVDAELETVAVLTGSIPADGALSGPELVKQVRADHPWIGKTIFGGGGLIPLRRVYDELTAPGIALVGDAACQVMPGHGSGIGFGLMAGKVLAEAIGSEGDPGTSDALWSYQAAYLREFGAILAGYDAVRRMSVALGPDGIEELYASGVFSEALVRPGLEQKLGMLGPRDALHAGRALASRPSLARIVVPALAAMGAARAIYRTYPASRSERALRRWKTAARVLPRQR